MALQADQDITGWTSLRKTAELHLPADHHAPAAVPAQVQSGRPDLPFLQEVRRNHVLSRRTIQCSHSSSLPHLQIQQVRLRNRTRRKSLHPIAQLPPPATPIPPARLHRLRLPPPAGLPGVERGVEEDARVPRGQGLDGEATGYSADPAQAKLPLRLHAVPVRGLRAAVPASEGETAAEISSEYQKALHLEKKVAETEG